MSEGTKTESTFRVKSVALPAEHGGWAFLFEPMLLGWLVAPSFAGFALSVSALGVFLIHQPLKIVLKDRAKGKRYERTQWAERFTLFYALLAGSGFALAVVNAGIGFLIPLLLAVPFACIQLFYETQNRGRESTPEICGAIALSALAPAIVLISNWSLAQALLIWLIICARAITSIFYVRVRLRLEKGKVPDTKLAIGSHVLTLGLFVVLVMFALTPKLVIAAFGVLLARAVYGLSEYRRPTPAKHIGFQEVGFGLLTVVFTALGYGLAF